MIKDEILVVAGFEVPKLQLLYDIIHTDGRGCQRSKIKKETFDGCFYAMKRKNYKVTSKNLKIFKKMELFSDKINSINKELSELIKKLE